MRHDLAPCKQCDRIHEIRELDCYDGLCYACYIKNKNKNGVTE